MTVQFQEGQPTEPCPVDQTNGEHEWTPIQKQLNQGTGDPHPEARFCLACGATDFGPEGQRLNWRDSPVAVFPAGTRSYRDRVTHNPDDQSPVGPITPSNPR